MKIFKDASGLRKEIQELRCSGKTIGFVPTMGALHEGHLQLLRTAAAECDVVACSIFVNPTQFNNPDDYRLYPRLPEEDIALLRSVNCDLLFTPDVAVMYPQQSKIKISFGKLEEVMEGAHRPGHFNGVATIVSKLFHFIQPHKAYFGQKDLQQYAIIRQMVADLSFDIELVCHPIIREEDGLAMSSRNRRLLPEHRSVAPELNKALEIGANLLKTGQKPSEAYQQMQDYVKSFSQIDLEYISIIDAQTLQPVSENEKPAEMAICIAAFLGDVRLIDNIILTLD